MRIWEIIEELTKAGNCVREAARIHHQTEIYQNTDEAITEAIEIVEDWADKHPGD